MSGGCIVLRKHGGNQPSMSSSCLLVCRNTADSIVPCPGVELLQPSTALAGLALFALLYSALARTWSARRAPLKQILDKHPLPHEEEAQLQASFLATTSPVPMRSSMPRLLRPVHTCQQHTYRLQLSMRREQIVMDTKQIAS